MKYFLSIAMLLFLFGTPASAECPDQEFSIANGGREVDIVEFIKCVNFLNKNQTTVESVKSSILADPDIAGLIQKDDIEPNKIVKVTYASGQGPNDATNDGRIFSRSLRFHKELEESEIRVLYSDVFRAQRDDKTPAGCRWSVRINGADCTNRAIYTDEHSNNAINVHSTSTLIGYCPNLPQGWHTVDVWVSPTPDNNKYVGSNCYTGWKEKLWTIEATELFPTPHNTQ